MKIRSEKNIQACMGFEPTTAQVVFITAKIAFLFTSLSAVKIFDFHVFTFVNSCDISSENLALDQLTIPLLIFFSISITYMYLLDILRRNSVLVTHGQKKSQLYFKQNNNSLIFPLCWWRKIPKFTSSGRI